MTAAIFKNLKTLKILKTRLLREPLLHFVVFGALVFGVDHVLEARKDNRSVITLSAATDLEARTIFRSALGRAPSASEMTILRERWVDNEVLYREGLALRVDQGDPTIRERVIFKALNVMQANLVLPKIDEQGLRAWFEQHRANYDTPQRYDFLEAVVLGNPGDETVRQFAAALNTGSASQAESGLRVFKGRPRGNLVASYGDQFAAALDQSPLGQWRALRSKEGLRVVRLEARQAGAAARYDDVQGKLHEDWKDATMQQLRTLAVRELGKKYTVTLAGAAQ